MFVKSSLDMILVLETCLRSNQIMDNIVIGQVTENSYWMQSFMCHPLCLLGVL